VRPADLPSILSNPKAKLAFIAIQAARRRPPDEGRAEDSVRAARTPIAMWRIALVKAVS
jgi:hypothetical protein